MFCFQDLTWEVIFLSYTDFEGWWAAVYPVRLNVP